MTPRATTSSAASSVASPRGTRSRVARVATPRVLVLRAAGTNRDRETAFAFEQAGATAFPVHVNEVVRRPTALNDVTGLVIPGGFSHGDDLGAGTVLGTRIRTRLVESIQRLVDRGGIVLGVCNGFQVLVKTGLVPGFSGKLERLVTLAQNLSNRYEDRWVTLEVTTDKSVFLRPGERYRVPVAHAEGRLLCANDAVRARLHAGGQVALRYVDPSGVRPVRYPWNPNGATDDIAGITDPTGRILGLMPHPERHQFPWQDPLFHREGGQEIPDGLRLFRNAVEHLRRIG